jgi:hypothetical protein
MVLDTWWDEDPGQTHARVFRRIDLAVVDSVDYTPRREGISTSGGRHDSGQTGCR